MITSSLLGSVSKNTGTWSSQKQPIESSMEMTVDSVIEILGRMDCCIL